jgi:hypothetical protein
MPAPEYTYEARPEARAVVKCSGCEWQAEQLSFSGTSIAQMKAAVFEAFDAHVALSHEDAA